MASHGSITSEGESPAKVARLCSPITHQGSFRVGKTLRSFSLQYNWKSDSAMASSRAIEFTPKEKQIFDLLHSVHRHYNLKIKIRVAGGWVRDKLLGKQSDDIDIALDGMKGPEFCDLIQQYLSSVHGFITKGFTVIKSNPYQSKHLETAKMFLFDVWIDVAHLRTEDYSDGSRIPTVDIGTPEADAYRRDLTINSLFYNIHDDSVEDFTGRGIDDLISGRIVTPLHPKETFLDDPLRVLRAIRIGARLGFELDDKLKIAASDCEVRAAMEKKITRERIAHEVELMVSGNEPVKAVTYICEFQLFRTVFTLPVAFEPGISDGYDRLCVAHMDFAWKLLQAIGYSYTIEQQRLCLYAALFLPFRGIVYKDRKNKRYPVVNYIFGNSLKMKVSDAEIVVKLHIVAQKFVSLIKDKRQFIDIDWKGEKTRIEVGLLLRDIKDNWRLAVVLSMLLITADIHCGLTSFELGKSKELYKVVEDWILRQGLEEIWKVKPLVNGKQIMAILDLQTGGPLVGEWQQKVLEWQLAHPSGTENECIDWIRFKHNAEQATNGRR